MVWACQHMGCGPPHVFFFFPPVEIPLKAKPKKGANCKQTTLPCVEGSVAYSRRRAAAFGAGGGG